MCLDVSLYCVVDVGLQLRELRRKESSESYTGVISRGGGDRTSVCSPLPERVPTHYLGLGCTSPSIPRSKQTKNC